MARRIDVVPATAPAGLTGAGCADGPQSPTKSFPVATTRSDCCAGGTTNMSSAATASHTTTNNSLPRPS